MKKSCKLWRYEYGREDFLQARKGIRPFADIYWFATDLEGYVALLFSGGFAPIPKQALEYEEHRLIATSLLENCPLESIERTITSKGIYLFDWNPRKGQYLQQPYELVTCPSDPRQWNSIFGDMTEPSQFASRLPCLFAQTRQFTIELMIEGSELNID